VLDLLAAVRRKTAGETTYTTVVNCRKTSMNLRAESLDLVDSGRSSEDWERS